MNPDDKAPPKGALEEAVSLFDELRKLVTDEMAFSGILTSNAFRLADLDSRRAALGPRLAKRRENQAKLRGAIEAVEQERREDQAKADKGPA